MTRPTRGSRPPLIGEAMKAEILRVARTYRSLEPGPYEEHLQGDRDGVRRALDFVDWCRTGGTTFGRANIDEVVARYEEAADALGLTVEGRKGRRP